MLLHSYFWLCSFKCGSFSYTLWFLLVVSLEIMYPFHFPISHRKDQLWSVYQLLKHKLLSKGGIQELSLL